MRGRILAGMDTPTISSDTDGDKNGMYHDDRLSCSYASLLDSISLSICHCILRTHT